MSSNDIDFRSLFYFGGFGGFGRGDGWAMREELRLLWDSIYYGVGLAKIFLNCLLRLSEDIILGFEYWGLASGHLLISLILSLTS